MKKYFIILLIFIFPCLYGQQLIQAEYFFDEDPGFGLATSINIVQSNEIEISENLDISNLSVGFHNLFIRVKDENNLWSSVFSSPFYIEANRGIKPVLTEVEYYFDQDPGYGNGIHFNDFQSNESLNLNFLASVENLEEGIHEYHIRAKDELGYWSQTYSQQFELVSCDMKISGQVFDEYENPITSGSLVLYQYFEEGAAIGVDTIKMELGVYEFDMVCPMTQYYMKMIPENNNDFLPTYFGDSPFWQNATMLVTEQSDMENINIVVTPFAGMELGTSVVRGKLTHADSKGEPVKNIDVILEMDDDLKNGEYQQVAYDRSDESGVWEMTDLPNGNFRIKVEIPGLEMDTTYYVNITSGNTVVKDLNFYIDFNSGIFVEHIGVSEYYLRDVISIFPNPTSNNQFWIQSISNNIKIEEVVVYNYCGQQISDFSSNETSINVNTSLYSKGFYLIKIKTNKGLVTEKMVIK